MSNRRKTVGSVGFVLAASALVGGVAAGWLPFSWLETVGVVTGAACVLLVVWRSVWNFAFGAVSCVAYLVFFAEQGFYAEAGLQVMFLALSVHGVVGWLRGVDSARAAVPVRRVGLGELTALVVLFPAVWLGLARLLEEVGGTAPYADSFITALSLTAQWLLNRRCVENWLGWIVVDQVAVALYWSRDLHLTAGLYALFLAMCVAGLIEWRRELPAEVNG